MSSREQETPVSVLTLSLSKGEGRNRRPAQKHDHWSIHAEPQYRNQSIDHAQDQ